jgi:hypothetical protein
MASIIKRKTKYSVVYYYYSAEGEKRQQWETFDTYKEALTRIAEVEYKTNEGTFIPPNAKNVSGFLQDFVSLYGETKWDITTYDGYISPIENYIKPLIGDEPLQNVNTLFVDKFYKRLAETKAVSSKHHKAKNEFVSKTTIECIHKLLVCAFKQAVRWELCLRTRLITHLWKKLSTNLVRYGQQI